MKKSYKLFLIFIICFLSASSTFAIDLYWVGGSGNWEDPNHWSVSSGGIGGAGIPGSSSNVIFDVNSSSQDFNVRINSAAEVMNFTVQTTNLLSLSGNSSRSLSVSASVRWNKQIKNQFHGEIILLSNPAQVNSIDFSKKIILGNIKFSGNGTWEVINDFWVKQTCHLESGDVTIKNSFVIVDEISTNPYINKNLSLENSKFIVDQTNNSLPSPSINYSADSYSYSNYFPNPGKIPNLGGNLKAITGFMVDKEDVSCFGFNDGKAWIDTIYFTGTSGPYTYLWKSFPANTTVSTSDTAKNLDGGLYSIRITDFNGTFSQQFVTINEPSVIGTLIFTTDETCISSCDGSIMVATTGGTPPYSYNWSDSQTTSTADSLCDGQYELTITDANGCVRYDTAEVNEPSPIQPNVNTSAVDCFGNCNGSASSSPTGGTGTYIKYEWSTGQSGAALSSISGLCAGNYSVTITDSDSCTNSQNFSISQPAAALSSTMNITDADCFGAATGSIALTPSGGTSPYSFEWDDGPSTSQNRSNLLSGTYIVTITDANGCTSRDTGFVDQPTAISISFNNIVNVFCNGDSTGSAVAGPSGGTTPYTGYAWANGDIGPTANDLPAGFHSVTVTDQAGCTKVDSVEITQPTAVAVTIDGQSDPLCKGDANGSINTTPSGGVAPYSYAWSDGSSTAEDRSNLSAGNYTLTVTDANSCTVTENVSLTDPAILSVMIDSIVAVSCKGGSDGFARAAGSGGTGTLTYTWSNAVNGKSNSNLLAGSYTVTVTDANNCTDTAIANIMEPTISLSASASKTDASCQGVNDGTATAKGTGGTSPYTYLWTGGDTSKTITGLSVGNYTVTITDDNGCTDQASVTIGQPSSISVNIDSQNLRCNNDNSGTAEANATGGTPPYSYSWSDNQTTKTAVNLSAGNYSVTVTDDNGCTGTANISISEPSQLNASINSHSQPSCNGGSDGTATVSASGGTSPYTYEWNDASNQTTQTASGLAAGSYTVTVTDDSLCSTTASISISQPAGMSIVDTIENVSCFGENDGMISLFVRGGSSPYTYNWSSGQNTSTISNLTAGQYNITVTDDNGCTKTDSFIVSEPTQLSVSVSGNNLSCYGDSTATLSGTASGGTTPYTYNWSSGQTASSISNMPAGKYKLTVTDDNGCTVTDSMTITQPQDINVSLLNSTNPSCNGASNGSISISASGGFPPFSYAWDDASSQTTSTATALPAGTYSVTITDDNGCTKDTSFSLTEPDSLILRVDSLRHISCNGETDGFISVSAIGGTSGYSFLWSNSQTVTTLNNLSAGNYEVIVTDANGCKDSTSISISEPLALGLSFSTDNVSCNGEDDGSITANPSGGTSPYSYLWSNDSTSQSIDNLAPGMYAVTVTDDNGCTIIDSVSITEPTEITTSINSTDVSCFGSTDGSASVTVSGGNGGYSYLWIPSLDTSSSISNLSPGVYVVMVSDANNCTAFDTAIVGEPDSLAISLDNRDNISCFGAADGSLSISVSGGTPSYTYLWSNNSTTSTISNLTAGRYSVTVTDNKGCTKRARYLITEPDELLLSLDTLRNVSCNGGNNGLIIISVTDGISPYSYSWSNSSTSKNQTNLTAGNYGLTVTDANGCTLDTSFSITEPNALDISFNQSNVACYNGNDGSATASVSGGTSPYTYLWSNSSTNSSINNLLAGTYSLTVTDANNCSAIDSVTITEPNNFTYQDTVVNNRCFGDCNGFIGISSFTGGFSPYQFNWSSNVSNSNSGSTSTEAFDLCAGNYSLTISDANGCDTVVNFNITQPNDITASLSSTLSHCTVDDGTATVNVSGGVSPYSYSWLGINQDSATAIGLDAGVYDVEITDANFCKDTFSIAVTDTAGPAISLSTRDASCFDASDGLAIANSVCLMAGTCSIEWLFLNGTSTNVFDDSLITSPGIYVSKVIENGCVSYDTISINSPDKISISVNSKDQSCGSICDGFIKLNTTGGTAPYSYNWSPNTVSGQGTDSIFNLCVGNYAFTITDANGCTYDSTIGIAQPNTLNISFTQTNVDCNGANTGSAIANVTGGTTPYSYLWSNTSISSSISNLTAGTYILTVTDNSNCSKVDSVIITETNAFSFIDSVSNNRCAGQCFGSIEIFGFSGGTSPYQFNWSSNVASSNTGSNSTIAFSLCAGNYSLTISDANGCDTILNYSITTPTALVGNVNSTFSHCTVDDGTATANPSGGVAPYSYSWLGLSQTTQTATGLDAGVYYVEITDANFCRDTFAVAVNDANGPSVSLSAKNASCHDSKDGLAIANSLCLMAGTCSIEWFYFDGSKTNVFNDSLIDSAGTYISRVEFNGCVSFDTISIGGPQELLANMNIQDQSCGNICNGYASANTQGGTPPYTYLWNPSSVSGQGTDSIFALCKGNYGLTITDANGCEFITSFTVDSASFEVSLSATDVSCNGANDGSISSSISGGVAPYSFNWSGGISGENPTNVAAGTYSLTVTDDLGCTALDTIEIIQPDSIQPNVNITNTSNCNMSDGSASLNPTGGTAPYSFEWFDHLFNPTGETGSSVDSLLNLNYFVIITDANSCVDTVFVPIGTDSNGPDLNYTLADENCTGSCDGSIDFANPCLNCVYLLYDLNGTLLSSQGPVGPNTSINFTNLCNDSYIIRVFDNNNFACSSVDTAIIGSGATFSLNLSASDALCNGTNSGSISSSITGGTAPFDFTWSGGLSGANPTNVAAGKYDVTVTDDVGCTVISSVSVGEPAAISYTSSSTNSSCNVSNGTATVSVNGGTGTIQVEWLDDNKDPIGQTAATATNLSAGIYFAALMDDNACVDTVIVFVNDANGPTANIFFTNESCSNSCDGSVSLKADCITDGTCTVVWRNSAGTIVGITDSIINLCADDYFATITDTAGCVTNMRTSVSGVQPITATLGSTGTSCTIATICVGTAYVNASGGTGSLSYEWFDANNNFLSTNDTLENICDAGIYFVDVTDQNGCSERFSVAVSDSTAASFSISTTDVSCGGNCDGTASVNINCNLPICLTRWKDANGLPIDSFVTSISGLCAGDYFVEVTNGQACIGIQKFTIEGKEIIQANASINHVLCNSVSSGSISLNPSGGTGNYSYTWSPAPTSGQGTNTASGLIAGTYWVTISDDSFCSIVESFDVLEPASMTANFSITNANCGTANGSVTASISGGNSPYAYQWFDPANVLMSGETSASLNNVASGTYRLRVNDNNLCEQFFKTTIADTDGPEIVLDSTKDITCFGDNTGEVSISVNGDAPFTYNWQPNGLGSQDIKNLTAGKYTVVVEDANKCISTEDYSITAPDELLASFDLTDATCGSCNGIAVISVSGGLAPYTYLWSNGSVIDTATNLCAGIYSVKVTDANACSETFNFSINNSGGITGENISTTATCFNSCDGTATVSPIGGTAPYSYLWLHNSSTQNSLSNLCAGTYYLQITDANACTRIAEVEINSPSSSLTAVENVVPTSCNGTSCDGSIFISASGGLPPYTYTWSPGTFADTNYIEGLCQGIYYLTLTDANSCSVMKSIYLNNEGEFLDPAARAVDVSCYNACDGGLLSNIPTTAMYSYQWLNAAGTAIAPVDNDVPSGVCAGIYTLQLTQLSTGCQNFYEVEVEQPDSIMLSPTIIRPILCAESCDGAVNLSVLGGELLYSYAWNDPNAQTSNPATGLCAGAYSVTVTDASGCTASTSVSLSEPTLFEVNIDNFTGVNCSNDCNGTATSTVSGGTPPYSFTWDGGQSTQDPTDLCYGRNILTVTDAKGCIVMDTVDIPAVDTVDVEVNADQIICEVDSIHLSGTVSGSNISNFAWYEMPSGTLFSASLDTSFTRPVGNYEFILVATNGACSDTAVVSIQVNESPMISAGNTITLYEDEVERINLSGADINYIYHWSPSEGLSDTSIANPIASTRETTMYVITVSTVDGCTAIDSVLVVYNPEFMIPSGFTPNGDGVNDVWEIDFIDEFPNAEMTVINRWGEEMFRSTGYRTPWDGTYKGETLPVGTYYFILDLKDSRYDPYTGPITIMR